MFKGVIFDLDNTIYDYDICNNYALIKLFEYIKKQNELYTLTDIETKYNKMNKNIKKSNNSCNKFNKSIYIKNLLEELKIPIKHFDSYYNLYKSAFFEKCKLFDYVYESIVLLHNNGIKIGILSNNIYIQQYEKLQKLGIIDYIDVIVTSDEIGEEKPHNFMFYRIQQLMNISFENMLYIGDNMEDDIIPSIQLGFFTFWLNIHGQYSTFKTPYSEINNYNIFYSFLQNYFQIVKDYVFISKYFGQSTLNVQGQGGNISIKQDNLLFIKSSGFILGNTTETEGYCIVDCNRCLNLLHGNNNINETKIFGYSNPSMETYFHSFMKKYTVHLHFTLSNIFISSSDTYYFDDFQYNYCVVDYFTPGIQLAKQIENKYSKECDIYFLKNHGLIITGDTLCNIFDYYEYIFMYFMNKSKLYYFSHYLDSGYITKTLYQYGMCKIVRKINILEEQIKNIVYCFPDLAIYIQNIVYINDFKELKNEAYDIIIYNSNCYCVCDNMTKMYSITEIIDSYLLLQSQTNNLISIENVKILQNMEQEKIRKQI
jgi:putative hydrolase of the HAD superfamily